MKVNKIKNAFRSRASNIILSKIDVKGGKFTFEQRIELGKIFTSGNDEIIIFKKVFKCLHDYDPILKDLKKLSPYLIEITEGLKFWIEAEQNGLKYEPSDDEKKAGILQLSKKLGELATIKSLAKNFGKDMDEVLKWEYGKVFGILFADLEEYKFQKKYNEVLEQKYKK